MDPQTIDLIAAQTKGPSPGANPGAAPTTPLSARVFSSHVLMNLQAAPVWQAVVVAAVGSFLVNLLFVTASGGIDSTDWANTLRGMGLGFAIAFSMWLSLAYLNNWLTHRVDWLDKPWPAFGLTLVANIVVGTTVLGFVYFTSFVILGDETALDWLQRQRFGNYVGSVLIGLLISAIYQGAYFIKLWRTSLVEAEQLKSANLTAKYETLNAQINPHFLFNSLNVLSALVKRDPDAAEGFIQGLSEVYRYVLDVRGEQMVSLERELRALDAYARLVLMRFGESRLRIDVSVVPQPGDLIVPLALQMLIENAVKHNGATRKNPLVVEVARQDGHIVVSNNKVPLFEAVESRGIGLANIRERYGLALGREVVVEDTEGTYAVRLPLFRVEDRRAAVTSRSAPAPPSPVGAGPARTR